MLKIPAQHEGLVNEVLLSASHKIEEIINEPVGLLITDPAYKKFSLEVILTTVCRELDLNEDEVKGDSRKGPIKDARHIACYLSLQIGGYSMETIAKFLNYYDHTPVSRACKRIRDMIDTTDEKILPLLNKCRVALNSGHPPKSTQP